MAQLEVHSLSATLEQGRGTTASSLSLSWEISAKNWNEWWGRPTYFGIKIDVVYETTSGDKIYQIQNNLVPTIKKGDDYFLNPNNFYIQDGLNSKPTNIEGQGSKNDNDGVEICKYKASFKINNVNTSIYNILIKKYTSNGVLNKASFLRELNSLIRIKTVKAEIEYYYNWYFFGTDKDRWRAYNFKEYNSNIGIFYLKEPIIPNKAFRPLNLSGKNIIKTSDKNINEDYVLLGNKNRVLSTDLIIDQKFLDSYSNNNYQQPSLTYPNSYDKLYFSLKVNNQIITDTIEYNISTKTFNKNYFTIVSNIDIAHQNYIDIELKGSNIDSNGNDIAVTTQPSNQSQEDKLQYFDLQYLNPQISSINLSKSILDNANLTLGKIIIYQDKENSGDYSNIVWSTEDINNISYHCKIEAFLNKTETKIEIFNYTYNAIGQYTTNFLFKNWNVTNLIKDLDTEITWVISMCWTNHQEENVVATKKLYYFSATSPNIEPLNYNFKIRINESENIFDEDKIIDKTLYLNPKDIFISDKNRNINGELYSRIKCAFYNSEIDSEIIELNQFSLEDDMEFYPISRLFSGEKQKRQLYISYYEYKKEDEIEIPYEQSEWTIWNEAIDFYFSRISQNQINIKPSIYFSNEIKELYQVSNFNESIQEDKKATIPVLKVVIDLEQTIKNSDFGGNLDFSNLKSSSKDYIRTIDFSNIKYILDKQELYFIEIKTINEKDLAIWNGINFKSYTFEEIDLRTFFDFSESPENIVFYLVDLNKLDGNNVAPLIGNLSEEFSLKYVYGPFDGLEKIIERGDIVIGSPTIYYRQHSVGINQEPNNEEVLFISPFEGKKFIRMGTITNYIQIDLETLTISKVINGESQDLTFN